MPPGLPGTTERTSSPLILRQAERGGEVLVERLEADAEIAALTAAGRCISASMTGLAASAGIARPMPTLTRRSARSAPS